MTMLSEMRNQILDELVNESLTDDQVDRSIRSAIRAYERRQWWFNERRITFNTTSGTDMYESETADDFEDIVEIISATIDSDTSDITKLEMMSYEEYDEWQTGTVSGRPTHIGVFSRKIYLYPNPSGTYRIRLSHTRKFDELIQSTETNVWLEEAEELIRQSAKRRIALDILHDDALAQRCAVLERDALDAMLAENRRRKPKKTLTVDPMLANIGAVTVYQE